MRKTVDWLIEDIHIFKNHYLLCNDIEKEKYRKGLLRYQGRFDSRLEFFKWYFSIVN